MASRWRNRTRTVAYDDDQVPKEKEHANDTEKISMMTIESSKVCEPMKHYSFCMVAEPANDPGIGAGDDARAKKKEAAEKDAKGEKDEKDEAVEKKMKKPSRRTSKHSARRVALSLLIPRLTLRRK